MNLWQVFCLYICFSYAHVLFARVVVIGQGFSEVVVVSNLKRAAIANASVAKIKAVPPNQVLITGKKVGKTMLRVWNQKNEHWPFPIEVISQKDYPFRLGKLENQIIHVKVEFIEIDRALSEVFGMEWSDSIEFKIDPLWQSNSGLNFESGISSIRATLAGMIQNGTAQILAKPELSVRIGEKAKFQSGGEFPVLSLKSKYGNYRRTIEWKPFGIRVEVQPTSANGIHISSEIKLEVSEINNSHIVEDVPSVNKRTVETKTISKNGETILLSGLVRKMNSKREKKVPLLSNLPVLGGFFFSSRQTSGNETELLLAVTYKFRDSQDRKQILKLKEKSGYHESSR